MLESFCYFGDLAGGSAGLVLKDNDMLHQVSFRHCGEHIFLTSS